MTNTTTIYNQNGKETDEMKLNNVVFGVEPNEHVVHEVFTAMRSNQREPWAHAKERHEVSGGGRKPWRQKGTGRARHGSIRSPLWTGGGATFGPSKDKNYKKKINRKKKKLATKMCLADKVNEGRFFVIEKIESSGKTKEMANLRDELIEEGKTVLMLIDEIDEKLSLATRNIPNFELKRADDCNVMDLLNNQYIIINQAGVEALEERFS